MLRVIGAGVGRTGTASLKLALEKLLEAPCYHMFEVSRRDGDVAAWHAAAKGAPPDWQTFFDGYAAAVDWPASAFWPELCNAFPDALVILSRRDPASWYRSASATIFPSMLRAKGEWRDMMNTLFASRFTLKLDDPAACMEALRQHDDAVRAGIARRRLLEWAPAHGFDPICKALGLEVPDEPFPHVNTTGEFLSTRG